MSLGIKIDRKTVIKIIFFIVTGAVVYKVLPMIFWNLTPDLLFWKGPAKGAFITVCFLLLLSWFFLKSDGKTFREIGVEWKWKRLAQFAGGVLAGLLMNAAMAFLLSCFFNFRWQLNPDFNIGIILSGLILNSWSAIAEELIYRGYAFKKTVDHFGKWKSIGVFVSLFAIVHIFSWGAWGDPVSMLVVFCTTGLGGLLFAIAFLKTKSLALPSGLHIGFIWANADFFTGMFARWYDNKRGLLVPVETGYYYKVFRDQWLLTNLPYVIVLLIAIFIISSWREKPAIT